MDSEPESVKQDVFLFPIFMLSYLQALVILKVKSMKIQRWTIIDCIVLDSFKKN